jgi:hypothetical protein
VHAELVRIDRVELHELGDSGCSLHGSRFVEFRFLVDRGATHRLKGTISIRKDSKDPGGAGRLAVGEHEGETVSQYAEQVVSVA